MRLRLQILCLKAKLHFLRKKRADALTYICINHSKIAGKINNLEDMDRNFFDKIDKEIEVKKRVLSKLKNKSKNKQSKTVQFQ
ncbi:MAG: hypothetical protein AABY15_05610 [Nanoarchaeota archaeon]